MESYKIEGLLGFELECKICNDVLNVMDNNWVGYANLASSVLLTASLLIHLSSWNALNTSVQNSNISIYRLGAIILDTVCTIYKNILGTSPPVDANVVKLPSNSGQ